MKQWPFALSIVLLAGAGQASALCGGGLDENNFQRPIDYNNAEEHNNIRLVERFHFTHEVETLQAGKNGPLPGDLEYTLRHIPNHYRALYSMAEWQRLNPAPPAGTQYLTADCYFERAFAFKPEDPLIYMIYGIYLHKKGDLANARAIYERGLGFKADNAELLYNLGLVLFDLKEYALAKERAVAAYSLGYPLPGLKHKLERVGQW